MPRTKEQGEFAEEIKETLDEWEERLRAWYVEKLPDMVAFLEELKERVEEFVEKIDSIGEEPEGGSTKSL